MFLNQLAFFLFCRVCVHSHIIRVPTPRSPHRIHHHHHHHHQSLLWSSRNAKETC
ncbi:hypothetical protein CY35_07G062600 [Sphagnum magellanicum]|uniref:Uncharacterized protein n=1 Tax=Sphagnum magellanicum TaxID=128215 RepID=A0ACB8HL82_9BRYO|nr:hypothetical protein CY35_07G062600 [Sphagnum magellanicum]